LARLALLLAILAGLILYNDPSLIRPAPEPGKPERVSETFIPCGTARAFACVVDGDSFRLGTRKIRIRGIDAPEREGACPAETALAARSAEALLRELNRGPFVMTAARRDERDQYGRELRILTRDGKSIGDALVAAGMAHDYRGKKLSWCP
jgi:micrococcal nuclease